MLIIFAKIAETAFVEDLVEKLISIIYLEETFPSKNLTEVDNDALWLLPIVYVGL